MKIIQIRISNIAFYPWSCRVSFLANRCSMTGNFLNKFEDCKKSIILIACQQVNTRWLGSAVKDPCSKNSNIKNLKICANYKGFLENYLQSMISKHSQGFANPTDDYWPKAHFSISLQFLFSVESMLWTRTKFRQSSSQLISFLQFG